VRHLSALTTVAAIAAIVALPATAGAAGAPTMPLSSVTPGMHCTADTVISGTDIVSYDVDVTSIVAGASEDDARILVLASGPNVDRTGIAQGFSGSPMWCPTGDGGRAIAGAVSAGVGDYGNMVGLVTPIAAVLGTPVDVPASAVRNDALLRSARPLTGPLTISGFAAPVAALLRKAAAKAGRTVVTSPAVSASARALIPPQTLQPGSSVSALYGSGDFPIGGVGTVTYTDGDAVWAFGHPMDGSGRRALGLGDAYVYTVVNNPIGAEPLVSYKLAAPVNTLGTLTYDGPNAIAGRVGPPPTMIPLTVTARDADRNKTLTYHEQLADERSLGNPAGLSILGAMAPSIVAQAAWETLQGNPSRQSGDLCMTITLAVRKAPIRFCNHYVGAYAGTQGVGMSGMPGDVSEALALLDGYQFGYPAITGVKIDMTLSRDRSEGILVSAKPLGTLKRGKDVKVRLGYRLLGSGQKGTRTVKVRVPRDAKRGRTYLSFTGTEANVAFNATGGGSEDITFDLSELLGDDEGGGSPKPQKLDEIIASIKAIHRPRGVSVSFGKPEAQREPSSEAEYESMLAAESAAAAAAQRVLAKEQLLISGKTALWVKVR